MKCTWPQAFWPLDTMTCILVEPPHRIIKFPCSCPWAAEHICSGADLGLFFCWPLSLTLQHVTTLLLWPQGHWDVRAPNPTWQNLGKRAKKDLFSHFITWAPEQPDCVIIVSQTMTHSNWTLLSVGTQNHFIREDGDTHTAPYPHHASLFATGCVYLSLCPKLHCILIYASLSLVAKSKTECQSKLSGFRIPCCKSIEVQVMPLAA